MTVRSGRALLAIAVTGAAGFCACTLFVGVPSDLTGASPGEGGAAEGAAPDAARGDGGGDAMRPVDGGPQPESGPRDGESDALDAGAYPPDSWCAAQPTQGLVLCDDFDHDTLGFSRWTTQDFGVLGSSGFSMTNVSPPYSLQIDVPPHMSSTYFLEVLEKDVPGSASAGSVTLDFQFQPVAWPDAGSGQLYIAAFAQGPGSPRVAVSVFTGTTGTELQEQDTDSMGNDTFNSGKTTYVPPPGAFSHLSLTVTFGATPVATLGNAGVPLVTLPLMGNWQASVNTAVHLGDWYVTSTPGFELLYDDATIRQQ